MLLRSLVVLTAFALTGCGIAQEAAKRTQEERVAAIKAEGDAATQSCQERFSPGIPSHAVARAKCLAEAWNILRPIAPFPDLWDLYAAHHLEIAERIQGGKLSIAQANVLLAEKRSELIGEEQRRLNARKAMVAQAVMAAASLQAAGPHSCTRIGATVNCF
jgi:hypothetical protein